MARRPSTAGPGGLSLFPFMSILACLIGVLTLLISVSAAMKSQETGGRSQEELRTAQEFAALAKARAADASRLKELQAAVATDDAEEKKLQDLQEKLAALRRRMAGPEAKDPDKSSRVLQKQLEDMIASVEQLKKERPALQKRLAALKAELEKRRKKPESIPPVIVQPGGTGTAGSGAKLFFVECTGEGLIIHRPGSDPQRVSSAAIGTDGGYNNFLGQVQRTPGSLLIFLMRQEGHTAWQRGAGLAESRFEIRTGKLPIPGKGPVDLRQFDKNFRP